MKEPVFDNFIPKIDYFVYRKCTPNWRLTTWFVSGYDITYVIEGKARYTIDGKNYELGTGDLLYLTEGTRKEAITFSNNLMHCFAVNFSQFSPVSKGALPPFPILNHIGRRKDIIDLFKELSVSWLEQQCGYIMKTRALLTLILHRLSEILVFNINSTPGDYRINRVIQTITQHYSDKLTVKELAEQVRLDEVYFGHLFKKETGMTVHQYINQIRIKNAENLLQDSNSKIYEVAEQCGFSDVVHFYKAFKSLRGFPPSRCLSKGK